MKFATTIIAAIIASATAFAPKGSTVRRSTGLNNYAPTKWSPKGGAAPAAAAPAPAAVSYDPAPTAAAPAPVARSGPPKNYSMTKWTPQGGAVPYGANGSFAPAVNGMAASEPAPFTPAPVSSSPAAPVVKNYKMTKWTPQGGAVPYGAPGSFTAAAAAAASAPAYDSAPVAASSAPAAPVKKNYSMTKWTPQGGAVPYSAPGSFTPAEPVNGAAAPEPVSYAAPNGASSYAAPNGASAPKSYSMTKWTPQGGAKPYTAPGSFTPAAVNGMAPSEPAPYVAPEPVAAAPAYASSAPKKNWSMTKWSPR